MLFVSKRNVCDFFDIQQFHIRASTLLDFVQRRDFFDENPSHHSWK
jgi:hypothetical protein